MQEPAIRILWRLKASPTFEEFFDAHRQRHTGLRWSVFLSLGSDTQDAF